MGLVSRIKGTPFHWDKILTTMLRRAKYLCVYFCLYFMHIICSLRMGLVSQIKGTPFHGDKILTTMLHRAG